MDGTKRDSCQIVVARMGIAQGRRVRVCFEGCLMI